MNGTTQAIPQGFMTAGALAKKMHTTVRTLQYYDKEDLLKPSAQSEGGRRLYTDKDVVRLHQIQALKYLGFSLDDIKHKLVALETPEQVAQALAGQAQGIRAQIASLSEVLQAIEKLEAETLQMEEVDFKKYADIIINLQMKNDFYWLIKHFDDYSLESFRTRFTAQQGEAMIKALNKLMEEAAALVQGGAPPDSERAQAFGKAWWDMVTEFTEGDTELLSRLMQLANPQDYLAAQSKEDWAATMNYIQKVLEVYFTKSGINPFEGKLGGAQ